MEHHFEVGKSYRNRNGEYEVVSLDGPGMVSRYANGSLLRTKVDVQARIWQNIQAEAQAERERQRAESQRRLKRRGGQRGLDFQGLEDHDFPEGVAGTHWRARASFGGRLAQRLTDTTPYHFESYSIYGRAVIHVAQPEHYSTETKWQEAKYEFSLNAEQARLAFYIEKNHGPMDSSWHWPNLIEALDNDTGLQQAVEGSMHEHKLEWELYVWDDGGLVARVWAGDEGLMGTGHEGTESKAISLPEFISQLRGIDAGKWADLYLCTHMTKESALAAGPGLVEPVSEVLRALLPLYEASTQQGRFSRSRS